MKLSDREKKIVAATCFGRTNSVSEISARTGLQLHAVRYTLERLLERQILQPYAVINSWALGYTEYQVFISLLSHKNSAHKRLIAELQNSDCVSWLSAVGGEFHLDCLLLARSAHEITEFFEKLSQRLDDVDFQKSVAATTSLSHFPPKYLGKYRFPSEPLSYRSCVNPPSLDNVDHQILALIAREGACPADKIARECSVPASTVRYRVNSMQERGIILGFGYFFLSKSVGMLTFNLLVEMKRSHALSRQKLFVYCQKHPNIVLFMDQLGAWDFQICATLESPEEVPGFIESFLERFEAEVRNVKPIPAYRTLKLSPYPFKHRPPNLVK